MPDVNLSETPLHLSARVTADELVELIADQWGQDEIAAFIEDLDMRLADYEFAVRCRDYFQAAIDKENAQPQTIEGTVAP